MIRRLAAKIASLGGDAADWLAYRRADGASAIEEILAGDLDIEGVGRLAIFMHFDATGRVAAYVRHYLRALRAAGFEIVFVSNAPRLDAAEIAPLCRAIVRRSNIGLDFGAWKDCWAALRHRDGLEMLLLANDSVYGPFHDLAGLLGRADPAQADVWGATDNWEGGRHLQSYFLLIHARALRHPAFDAFWRGVRHVASKRWIIRHYEIGLTRALEAAGLKCAALFPYATLSAARTGKPVNPTHFFWNELISRAGFPFLKRDLLTRNAHGLPMTDWRSVVASASAYDTGLIDRHLAAKD